MAELRVKLEGFEELPALLAQLGLRASDVLEPAVKAAAAIVVADASGRQPDAEIDQETVERAKTLVQIDVGPSKEKWFFRFLETGAGSHAITGAPLAFEGDEGLVLTGGVQHPGMAAQPFLRPALDGNEQAAQDAMGERLRDVIERVGG